MAAAATPRGCLVDFMALDMAVLDELRGQVCFRVLGECGILYGGWVGGWALHPVALHPVAMNSVALHPVAMNPAALNLWALNPISLLTCPLTCTLP